MNDQEIQSRSSYEWDNVCRRGAEQWRRTHNHIHHTYTNVVGHDDDIGYGVLRIFPRTAMVPGQSAAAGVRIGDGAGCSSTASGPESRIDLRWPAVFAPRGAAGAENLARKIRKQVPRIT